MENKHTRDFYDLIDEISGVLNTKVNENLTIFSNDYFQDVQFIKQGEKVVELNDNLIIAISFEAMLTTLSNLIGITLSDYLDIMNDKGNYKEKCHSLYEKHITILNERIREIVKHNNDL